MKWSPEVAAGVAQTPVAIDFCMESRLVVKQTGWRLSDLNVGCGGYICMLMMVVRTGTATATTPRLATTL